MTTTVDVGGVRISVEEHGTGPTVALQPGLGYASWCWRWLVPELTDRHHVLALDTRGTGGSTKPDEPFSVEDMADDLAAVVDELGDGPAHVVGHSMGGYIAITTALRYPETVRSLVLLATSAGGPGNIPVPAETVAVWRDSLGLPLEEYARVTFPYSFRPGWTEENPELTEEALRIRLEHPTPPEQWLYQYNATVPWLQRGAAVEEIAVPSLVVHGTADRVVPYGNGENLARQMADAELVTFEGAGHNLIIEEPARLASLMLRFWEELDGS